MMRLLIHFRNLLLFTQEDTTRSVLAWIAILLFVAILVVLLAADRQFIGYRLRVGLGLPTKRDKEEEDPVWVDEEDAVSLVVGESEKVQTESLDAASGVEFDSTGIAEDSGIELDGTKAFEYSGKDSASEGTFFVARAKKAVRIKEISLAEACGKCAELVKDFLLSSGVIPATSESVPVSFEESAVEPDGFLNIPSEPDNRVEDFLSSENQPLDSEETEELTSVGQVSENSFVDNFRSILIGAEDVVGTLNSIKTNKNFNSYAFESLSDQVGDLYSKLRAMGGVLCDDQFVAASSDTVDSKQIQETIESIANSDFLDSSDTPDFSKNSKETSSSCDKPAERAVLSELEVKLLLGDDFTNSPQESVLPAEEVIPEPELSVEESAVEPVLSSDAMEDLLASETGEAGENDIAMEKSIAWLESMLEESPSVPIEEVSPIGESDPELIPEAEVPPEPSALDLCMDRHKGFVPAVESEDFSFTCKLDGAFVLSNEDGKLYFSNILVRVNDVSKQWTNRKIAFHKNDVLDVDTGIVAKFSENLKYSYAVNKEELLQVHGLKITDFYYDEQDSLHAEFFALKDSVVSFEDGLIVLKVNVK